jgi:hypothetical protein
MTADLWILLSLALLTELLTLPPLVARGSVPGGIKWIFYNRDTELASVAPWGGRAVRAHSNLADNLAMYRAGLHVGLCLANHCALLGALNSGPGNKAAYDTYRGKAMLGSRRSQRPFEDQKNLEVKR